MRKVGFLSLLIWSSLTLTAYAAPTVTGVSGTVSDGQTIAIAGSNFGASGPNIVFFDDLSKGSNGGSINLAGSGPQPVIGNYTYTRSGITFSNEYPHSGNLSMRIDYTGDNWFGVWTRFPAATEVFFSMWTMLPVGRDVGGTNSSGGPNWKLWWLNSRQGGGDTWNSDYLPVVLQNLPSSPAQNNPSYCGPFAGDDGGTPSRIGLGYNDSWMSKGRWHRCDFYGKNSLGTSAGVLDYWLMNEGYNHVHTINNMTGCTGHSGEPWEEWRVPGFTRNDPNCVVYADDIYIATGPNCRARVEIGNASTYAACTNMAISTPTAWSDGQITATMRQGSFKAGATAYVYVVDSTGTPSAGYPVTIGSGSTPPPPTCTASLSSTSASMDSTAQTGVVSVTTSTTSCTWTAVSNSSWITVVSGASGTGSSTVQYSVTTNTGSQRVGTMTIAGTTFTVTQAAGTASCTVTLSPTSASLTSIAQTGSFGVTVSASSCTWSATANNTWITISSGSTGTRTGSGTVQYSITENTTSAARTGTITVADQTFTITQAVGTTPQCTFSLSANAVSFNYQPHTGVVNVISSAASCAWTAKSNSSWITITTGASGTGTGSVYYSITQNNTYYARTGTITIAGATYTVTQAAYSSRPKPHPPRNLYYW